VAGGAAVGGVVGLVAGQKKATDGICRSVMGLCTGMRPAWPSSWEFGFLRSRNV